MIKSCFRLDNCFLGRKYNSSEKRLLWQEQKCNIVICISLVLVRWFKLLRTFNLPLSTMATIIIKTDTLVKDNLEVFIRCMTTDKSVKVCQSPNRPRQRSKKHAVSPVFPNLPWVADAQ